MAVEAIGGRVGGEDVEVTAGVGTQQGGSVPGGDVEVRGSEAETAPCTGWTAHMAEGGLSCMGVHV